MRSVLIAVALVVAACSGAPSTSGGSEALPSIDGPGIRAVLADLDRPAVVNVWASWCIPCRSEAPLLAAAHEEFQGEVRFIGIDVRDSRPAAEEFIAEFGLDFEHYFDADAEVPAELGGFGVPITYFVDPSGEVVETHSGIMDEPTLETMLDELAG